MTMPVGGGSILGVGDVGSSVISSSIAVNGAGGRILIRIRHGVAISRAILLGHGVGIAFRQAIDVDGILIANATYCDRGARDDGSSNRLTILSVNNLVNFAISTSHANFECKGITHGSQRAFNVLRNDHIVNFAIILRRVVIAIVVGKGKGTLATFALFKVTITALTY